MRPALIGWILVVSVLAQQCASCEEVKQELEQTWHDVQTQVAGEPSWRQVEYSFPHAAREWKIEEFSSAVADDCDRAASAVALAWANEKAFTAAGGFLLSYLTKEAITKSIDAIWPGAWAIELLRDQIVKRVLDFAEKRLLESAEVRGYDYQLAADKVVALNGDLVGTYVSDYILAEYDPQGRTVMLMVTSDCGGPTSPFGPRLWEVTYEVNEFGQPVDLGAGFRRVNVGPE